MSPTPDDDLLRLMRNADPARDLAPLDTRSAERVRECAMNTAPETARAARGPRARRWAFGGLGALGAAGAAALVVPLMIGSGAATVTALDVPGAGGPAAACAEVTVPALQTADLAFRGVVESVEGGTASLKVTERFAGEPGDTVTIPQGEGVIDGQAPVFEPGVTYLVAASGDLVLGCGLTGTDTPPLAQLYSDAFAAADPR